MNSDRAMLSEISNIIFDLDGTLVDPLEGITEGYREVCQHLGVDLPGPEVIRTFIGPNIQTVLSETFALRGTELDDAVFVFRNAYGKRHLLKYQKYPGMEQTLEVLIGLKKNLYVATSKMQTMAIELIDHVGWSKLFQSIAGVQPEAQILTKTGVLTHLVNQCGLQPAKTVMVGDRGADMESAQELQMYSIGVLWGYGDFEELNRTDPSLIIRKAEELSSIFFQSELDM